MQLDGYVADLHDQLALAAEAGGAEARALAERLIAALDPAARLALLHALSAAAAEITAELAPGSVEVRLRGRDPEFVVALPPPAPGPEPGAEEPVPLPAEDTAMARINLRLPQDLKDRVEDAARAAGLSVNSWLVRSAAAALSTQGATPGPARATTPVNVGERYRGWVR